MGRSGGLRYMVEGESKVILSKQWKCTSAKSPSVQVVKKNTVIICLLVFIKGYKM